MSKITKMLGIDYPIFQGAMAQISKAPLVGAVSEAGGLGIIASGGMSGPELVSEIRQTKALTKKPFAVNVMLMMKNCEELIDVLIAEGVKIITTGAGTPKPYMAKLKAAGVIVIPVVPSVKLALKMAELGADAVIAEGTEAGGHIGEVTTMALLPQVTAALSIPVIGAGGISDGRGMAAAFALGAQGIQMGTVYLTAEECPISVNYKQAIVAAQETSTVVTGRNNGAPVRTLRNKMTEKYLALEKQEVDREVLEELTLGSLRKAVVEGDVENGSLMAGQIAGNIKSVRSAKEITLSIMKEAQAVSLNI